MPTKATPEHPHLPVEPTAEIDGKLYNAALQQLSKVTGRSIMALDAALDQIEGEELKPDPDAPPFHRSVCWADISTPDGIRVHVVSRGGETVDGLLETVLTMGDVLERLLSEHGYLTGSRASRTVAAAQETDAEDAGASGPRRGPRRQDTGGGARRISRPAAPDEDQTDSVKVVQIVKTLSGRSNQVLYRVQGGNWMEHGVSCWVDSGNIEQLADVINLAQWEIGEVVKVDDLDIHAIYTLKADGNPGKVIAWEGEDVIPLGDIDNVN